MSKSRETIRIADHDIKPGVTSDEGDGDAWPDIRRRILDHDILIFGTPIWLGQPSSLAKRVVERMDAFFSETDDDGRMPSFGKVAVARHRRQRGRRPPRHRRVAAGAQRHRLDHSRAGRLLLGRRSHAQDRLQGPAESARTNVQGLAGMLASNAAHLAYLLKQNALPRSAQGQVKPALDPFESLRRACSPSACSRRAG